MSDKLLITQDMVASNDILNPFIHHLELTNTYDKIRTAFFTVVILPIRLCIIAALLVLAWLLACVALYTVSEEELSQKPLLGWRRMIREWICVLGRSAYYAGGMHIRVKGRQAARAEAPILVIAPHSTFLDAVIVYVAGFPSIIVRRESGMNPWLGKLINCTQPVYVGRDDPNSRQKTITDIINRTTSKEDWPQILIFPEGTCTNRTCLITFKPGAFYPGVPVQPVLIRYPNKLDTVTWTWDGPGALKLLWLTLTQAHSKCEIEFLPVYRPNDDEKKDPKLYANNVRTLMAKTLGVPTSDYSYEDCRLVKKAKDLQLPQSSQLILTQKLRSRLGVTRRKVEDTIIAEQSEFFEKSADELLSIEEFANVLGVPQTEHDLRELFDIYCERVVQLANNEKSAPLLNLKKYLLAVALTSRASNRNKMIRVAFECFNGKINKTWFQYIMMLVYFISYEHSESMFNDIIRPNNSCITLDEYSKYVNMYPEVIAKNNNSSVGQESNIKVKSH